MKIFRLLLLGMYSLKAFGQNDPKTDWPNLAKYAAENAQLPAPAKHEKRVVFMGNSVTEFWKPTDSSFFAGKPYINRGIAGQSSPQMLLRFHQDVVNLRPKVVVISAGINDIAENNGPIEFEDILANIQSMVDISHANNIKVVLCSLTPADSFWWRPALRPANKIVAFNKVLAAYAQDKKLIYVDYFTPLVGENNAIDKRYSDDAIHPNLAGYRLMEPLVETAIKKALSIND